MYDGENKIPPVPGTNQSVGGGSTQTPSENKSDANAVKKDNPLPDTPEPTTTTGTSMFDAWKTKAQPQFLKQTVQGLRNVGANVTNPNAGFQSNQIDI